MNASINLTTTLIDSISQATKLIEKSDRFDKLTNIKILEQTARFLNETKRPSDLLNTLKLSLQELRCHLINDQEITSIILGINILTSDIFSSLVEIVPEESGGVCSRICELRFNNGEFYYSPQNRLTTSDYQYDLTGYPSEARLASEYFNKIDKYSGFTQNKLAASLSYYLSSTTLKVPGKIKIKGTDENTIIRCRAQVENDLGRFTSVTIDKELSQKKNAKSIMEKLRDTLLDNKMTEYVSQLMTQATIAGASTDFFLRFTNHKLKFGFTSPSSCDVVVRNRKDEVEVSIYALYHIRDLARLPEIGVIESLPIFRSCVVQRKIVISKESLKNGRSKGGKLQDSYSNFFGVSTDAEGYRLKQLSI